MTDEHTLLKQIEKGERSQVALEEIEDALAALDKQCYEVFRNSDPHDDEGRRACRYYLRVLDDFKSRLVHQINKGKAANTELVTLRNPSLIRRVI